MNRTRILDWRFLLALALLMLVSWLVWSGLEATHEARASSHRNDVLIQRLNDQEHAASARENEDDRQRGQLLAQQGELLTKYGRLERSQRRLLRWLRNHGVSVPVKYVDLPVLVTKTVTKTVPGPTHTVTLPPKPGPTVTVTPQPQAPPPGPHGPQPHIALPNGPGQQHGHSGNPPGHHKH